jgi:hypothetical protein
MAVAGLKRRWRRIRTFISARRQPKNILVLSHPWIRNLEREMTQQEADPPSAHCPPVYNGNPPGTAIPAFTSAPAVWTSTLTNAKSSALPDATTQILATASGMGCRSSAGIRERWCSQYERTAYNPQLPRSTQPPGEQSGQLTADFSWLMSQKANWDRGH